MQLPGTYSNKATEGEGEDGKQGKRGKKGLKAKQQPDGDEEEDNEDDGSEKREFAPSRLIVEFAVSNHNVLKQQRDKKHKEKAVKELSITQKSQGEGEEEGEKMKMMKKKSLEITWNESAKIDAPVNIQQMPDSSHSHIRHSFILIL